MELLVDSERLARFTEETSTGIYVRAKHGEKWGSFDILVLTLDSLRVWLRSRGGVNEWSENTVAMLLGHALGNQANDRPDWADREAADHAARLTNSAVELTDKLLDDLNDRSGFSLDSEVRQIIRDEWIVLIGKHLVERYG